MYLLSVLFVSASIIFLGFLILNRNHKSKINISFFSLAISLAIWAIANYLVDFDPNRSLFWAKMTFLGPVLMIPSILFFSYLFPFGVNPRKPVLVFFLVGFIVLLPTIFFGYLVESVDNTIFPAKLTYAPGYYFFLLYFFGGIIFSIYSFIRKYLSSSGLVKQQIRYVFAGVAITALFGIITNILLPVIGIGSLVALGPLGTLFLVVLVSYAIVRHRLLDIRLVATRSLIYGLLLTLVTLSFVFITFTSARFFEKSQVSQNSIAFLVAALIVFGLDPLKRLLSRATDKVFFKAKIDYQAILRKLSETLSFELDQTKLITDLRTTLTQELKIKFAATLLRRTSHGGTDRFEALPELLGKYPNMVLQNESQLVHYLREHRHPAIYESLERKIDDTKEELRGPLLASKEEFEKLGAALIAPVYAQDHLIAVLVLGSKLSGDTFSNDDVNLIEVLSPQIGSAIQKANLFEEVREFGENLKVKVKEATEKLEDRNVSLQTLQNITKEVTRTLDFSQAVQNIANSVATELGYLGAILVFLDQDGRTVRARAITETPLTKKAMRLLPLRFDTYHSDIMDPASNSLGHQVIRTGEIKITDSMSDVLSPPLPKIICASIQKLMGLKSMVLVPIISESRTIGVIEIGLQKSIHDITPQEIATMQSMADELGIVSRNLTLFSQLKETNGQLEVANKHLQELDRAKSEFVSIASHQLRTPMTGIMGYLSMMTQGDFGKMKPDHLKILTDLLAESQRMIRLINQFLNVSKIEAGKFTYTKVPVQFEDLVVREIKEVTKAANDKGLKILNKLPKTPLPKVMVDADKIQDVILNLIDNAIKYTDKGSITLTAELEDERIHFRAKDTGIGIKPQDATELFNKFVRGSGIAQIHPDGSGLGLFIAKSIIDAHGGRIWAESDGEGKGSTFQFILPLVPHADAPEAHPHQAAAHVVSPRS